MNQKLKKRSMIKGAATLKETAPFREWLRQKINGGNGSMTFMTRVMIYSLDFLEIKQRRNNR